MEINEDAFVARHIEEVEEMLADLHDTMQMLAATFPHIMGAINNYTTKVAKTDSLTHKDVELEALAIAYAMRCTPCIVFHIKNCQMLGATWREVAGRLPAAVEMGGGPVLTHSGNWMIKCLDYFYRDWRDEV